MVKEEQEQQVISEEEELAEDLTEEAEETPEEVAPEEETAHAEEKVKPKKKKADVDIVEERIYTVPLQKALVRPPKKRAPRAISLLKAFIVRHMKLNMHVSGDEDEEQELPQLVISKEVNEKIWGKGIEKPPRRIKVRAAKDKDGNVTVYLAE
jgi:large subunit ribosomal protein L31e